MVRRAVVPVALVLTVGSCTAPFAQPASNMIYIRGSVGIATLSMSDINREIDREQQVFTNAGIPVDFKRFSANVPVGIEVGYMVAPAVSIGVGVGYRTSKVSNSYEDPSGSFSDAFEGSITDATANVSYWIPGAMGFFVGAQAGMGFGRLSESFHVRDSSDPNNNQDIEGDWSGNAAVLGVFLGYQHVSARGPAFHARTGYQFMNMGKMDGTATSPQLGRYSGPPLDGVGREMDTDFSGIALEVGIGFGFGGR